MVNCRSRLLEIFLVVLITLPTTIFSQERIKKRDAYFSDFLHYYIEQNTKPASVLNTEDVMGDVIVQIEVSESGAVENATVVDGICPSCDEEAIRVVTSMPDWNCAYNKGRPVRSTKQIVIPILNSPASFGFDEVDSEPVYMGDSALYKGLELALIYPDLGPDIGPCGIIKVDFVVSGEGIVTYANTNTDNHKIGEEAKRVVMNSGPWKPAEKWGVPVNRWQHVYISFIDPKEENQRLEKSLEKGVRPEFPGGFEKFIEFIQENIKLQEKPASATVYVKFQLSEDGYIFDVTSHMKGNCTECKLEAERVISLSPRWKVAYQDGKPVPTYQTVPVQFSAY